MNIEIYEFKDGDWAYRLNNKGRILLHSEGYANKSNAERALKSHIKGLLKFLNTDWAKKIKVISKKSV